MVKRRLSGPQRRQLESLAEEKGIIGGRGQHLPICSLVRRGLVMWRQDCGHFITPAGFEALKTGWVELVPDRIEEPTKEPNELEVRRKVEAVAGTFMAKLDGLIDFMVSAYYEGWRDGREVGESANVAS